MKDIINNLKEKNYYRFKIEFLVKADEPPRAYQGEMFQILLSLAYLTNTEDTYP